MIYRLDIKIIIMTVKLIGHDIMIMTCVMVIRLYMIIIHFLTIRFIIIKLVMTVRLVVIIRLLMTVSYRTARLGLVELVRVELSDTLQAYFQSVKYADILFLPHKIVVSTRSDMFVLVSFLGSKHIRISEPQRP